MPKPTGRGLDSLSSVTSGARFGRLIAIRPIQNIMSDSYYVFIQIFIFDKCPFYPSQ